MSNIYKGEFQDYEGNVVYPHTSADVVFATDGQTIQKKLNDAEIDYTDVKAQLTSGEHEFRFGVTADGEFGYHKEVEGADTVIPFSRDINIGDRFIVTLDGSHNQTITATVCYIDKTTVCLLGDTSLGEANWSTQRNYAWNYSLNINGKDYTGMCKIPTFEQIYSKCAGYMRDFAYRTSTKKDSSSCWVVSPTGSVGSYSDSNSYGTLPFIEITL